jgi:hypothetical protein
VFAYLFFLFFPHVAALTHSHADDADGHNHAFLSAHDLGLERAALAVAPEGSPSGELDREESPRAFPVGKNEQGLHAPRGFAHTHVQDDPNVVGLGIPELAPAPPEFRPEAPPFAAAFAPEPAAIAASARAPPRG